MINRKRDGYRLLILAGVLACGRAAVADAPRAAPEATTAVAATDTASADPRASTALSREFAAVLQDEAARLRGLEARFRAASDASAAIAIEREIAALKSGTESRLMDVQARLARAAGRLEEAARIESAMADMAAAQARVIAPPPAAPRAEAGSHAGGER